jgi:hypothetical protein
MALNQAKALSTRVVVMCLVVVPCWLLHRVLAESVDIWSKLFLLFFFLGPIVAGLYAGTSGGRPLPALSGVAVASVVLTLIYAALWLRDLSHLQRFSLMGQLFLMLFGLLFAGALPALVMRGRIGASRREPFLDTRERGQPS